MIKEGRAMTKIRLIIFPLLGLILCNLVLPVQAQAGIQLVSDTATLSFPNTATFKAEFKSGVNIASVILEYGVDQLTCGNVIAKAFPQFTAATDVQVQWAWDMRQSGSIPPGATLWWHWLIADANGTQFTSPTQTIIWLDSTHNWQVISGGNINLHYYDGGQSFGQTLHDAAAQALVRLSSDVGISSDKPVNTYIYANTNDLQASILYAPSWVGGQAFPETNIVIIGISTDQLDWGKSTEAHELTHVLVGHLTFSCLGFIPTWLNEGLAMYGQGGPEATQVTQFNQAKSSNQLLALSSLAGAFSDEANRANLSYTEAYSVTNYLIQTYGRDKMTALLISLRDGNTIDQALQSAYGFDTNGLEDAWRASISAAPRVGTSNPTPVFTPTQVPTFVPISAAPLAPAAPTLRPTQLQAVVTPVASVQPSGPAPTSIPLAQQLGISPGVITGIEFGLLGCILAIVVITVPVIITTRRHSRRPK
jgi:hypothetical protein